MTQNTGVSHNRMASEEQNPHFGVGKTEPRPQANRDVMNRLEESHTHETSKEYGRVKAISYAGRMA